MTTSYVAGQYTAPAATVLTPPHGGVLWGIWVRGQAMARMLIEDLLEYGAHFGQETWDDDTRALIVVFVTMPATEALREICTKYGPIATHAASLDVTGVWEEHRG
jgi:hypothetical protein